MIERQLLEWQAAEQAALDAEHCVKHGLTTDGFDSREAQAAARSLRAHADNLLRAMLHHVEGSGSSAA